MFADSNMDLGQKNRITLLRVIPAVAFYLILVLAFYLIFFPAFFVAFYLTFLPAFYLTSILTYFLTFWHSIVKFFLTFFPAFYLPSILTYFLTFYCEILSDILSGILSGIYSDIPSGILSGIQVQACPAASGAGDMVVASKRVPQHLCPKAFVPHSIRSWQYGVRRALHSAERRPERWQQAKEGRKEGGVAHLLKSRGRHLAGREILGKYKCSTPTFWTTWLPFRA